MNFETFSVIELQIFLVIFARVTGFIAAVPLFSSMQTPYRAKAVIALMLAWTLFPILRQKFSAPTDFSLAPLTLLVISEALLGMLLALIARLIFVAVEYGGNIIGFQMGFSAANVYDPQNQGQIQLVSQFQNIFATFIFLSINGHFIFFETMVGSFTVLPPGTINLSGEAVPYLMELTSKMFILGLQFSAPVLTVLLLCGLILGVLARVFPQLNVFMLSFPINISVALFAIAITLNMMAGLVAREVDELSMRFVNILSLLKP